MKSSLLFAESALLLAAWCAGRWGLVGWRWLVISVLCMAAGALFMLSFFQKPS